MAIILTNPVMIMIIDEVCIICAVGVIDTNDI